MKAHLGIIAGVFLCHLLHAENLPVFSAHPQNQQQPIRATATLSCAASGADSFQWRQNGEDIPGATNSTLTIPNAQSTDNGYYVVIAKNATGWTPSQMAYLNVTGGGGILPLSNVDISNNSFTAARYQIAPPGNSPGDLVSQGIARIVAGPELDQLQVVNVGSGPYPFGPFDYWDFAWGDPGYFDGNNITLTNISPGQSVYYQVQIAFSYNSWIQYSTTLGLVAGGGANPVPQAEGLKWPTWPEWPEPKFLPAFPATNQLLVLGETTTIQFHCFGYMDFGSPKVQWRKDGREISGATNIVDTGLESYSESLTLSNIQPTDAGVYDMIVYGNQWVVSPRISIRVQSQNGSGVFQYPRQDGGQFLAEFIGAAGRNYMIECSTNLVNWSDLLTLTNTSGALVFSNNIPPDGNLFYRSRLLQ